MKILFACIFLLWAQSSAAGYTAWLDRDNYGGVGDFETYVDFNPAPCSGTPTAIQVRVKGTSTIIISTDQRITVGPEYGLTCVNAQQGGGYCKDYKVQYKDSTQTSILFDRDNPSGQGDYEPKNLIQGTAWRAGTHITWNVGSGYYGTVSQRLVVGPAYGLSCVNDQQSGYCLDYEVRFNCP